MVKSFMMIVLCSVLAASELQEQTETEPNDARAFANGPINFDETLTGGLPGIYGGDSSFPQDYWVFTGVAGHQYEFVANPQNSSFVAPLDLALDIEDSGGTVLVSQDDNGDHLSETLNWTCPADGTYYLIVWEATGTSNAIAWYTVNCTDTGTAVDDWTLY